MKENRNWERKSIVMEERLCELLSAKTLRVWNDLVSEVDSLYDMDKLWNKGFGKLSISIAEAERHFAPFMRKKVPLIF